MTPTNDVDEAYLRLVSAILEIDQYIETQQTKTETQQNENR